MVRVYANSLEGKYIWNVYIYINYIVHIHICIYSYFYMMYIISHIIYSKYDIYCFRYCLVSYMLFFKLFTTTSLPVVPPLAVPAMQSHTPHQHARGHQGR